MEKRSCPPGSSWDSLLKYCISHESLGLTPSPITDPLPVLKPVMSNTGPVHSPGVSPIVWICVGLVVGGSVLVLLFCSFIIYKRQSGSGQHTAGVKDSAPHRPPQTTPAREREAEPLSALLHPNGNAHEVPISEGTWGRSLCNGRAEHALPLPATELGDSALVTTKTGQPVDV